MKTIAVRIVLVMLGFLAPVACIALVLQLFPGLIPDNSDPLNQRRANDEYQFIFTDYMGDAFSHQPGMVRPPEENRVLEDFQLRYGEDGFRVPRMVADEYPIIALGDSYTEGGPVPWVDVLASELDTPVRNLGWRGLGTLDQARIMEEYGKSEVTEWVLIGYFEGNDLSNIQSAYDREQNVQIINFAENLLDERRDPNPELVLDPNNNYLYPLRHTINEQEFELAYVSDYIWWLNGNADTYRNSRNVEELRRSLRSIQDDARDACVALVYMPNKGHIYFPYTDPEGNRRYVMENGRSLYLNDNGWLALTDLTPLDETAVFANFDNQRDVVQEVADELGLHFIDLVPAFEQAAADGEMLYYPYDSHWNPDGHALAGRTVADYIRQNGCAS
jgi:hypothetical protein